MPGTLSRNRLVQCSQANVMPVGYRLAFGLVLQRGQLREARDLRT
jgi:hypothetical protein